MTEKRYTITIGQNNEFKEIIDHHRQDKQISVFEFLKQVGEQDKAFKKVKKENKELKEDYLQQKARIEQQLTEYIKENRTLKLLVQNWEKLDDEKDEQLEKMNDSLKRRVEENKQLQQELFESERECLELHYHDNEVRRDDRIEMLKEEFKERFGRDFE